jgi:hypothetical protein
MEDSRGVIPHEPTEPPNELLHQSANHISILYPGPFRLPTQFAGKIDALCDLYPASILSGLSQTWVAYVSGPVQNVIYVTGEDLNILVRPERFELQAPGS